MLELLSMLVLVLLFGLAAASCIFPPPIDTSTASGNLPPAIWQAQPPLGGPYTYSLGTQLDLVLEVEDPDLGDTLTARLFADYSQLRPVPALETVSIPPPADQSDPSAAIRTIDFGMVPYCGSTFSADGQQHQLLVVISDRGFDDAGLPDPRYMATPKGAGVTQGTWLIQCAAVAGDGG